MCVSGLVMYDYRFMVTFNDNYSLENFALCGFCRATCVLVTMAFLLVITDLKDYWTLQILKQEYPRGFYFQILFTSKSYINVMFRKWSKYSSAEWEPFRMWIRKVETNRPWVLEIMCYKQTHLQIKDIKSGRVIWQVHLVKK